MRVQVGMKVSSQAGSATEEEYSIGVEQVNRYLAVICQQISFVPRYQTLK